MYYDKLVKGLYKKIEDIKKSQDELDGEFFYTRNWLDELTHNMDSLSQHLKQITSEKVSLESNHKGEKSYVLEEDSKKLLERLLQGSLQDLGDKISRRILDKLRDLQGTSGPLRETKIKELKEIADSESVDLSRLFQEKVESNIEDIGIEEKEAKGIDKDLEKLRRMRQDKNREA